MAQAERELTPYSSPSHFFGAELRHWRRLRGLSQNELGLRVFCSGHLIGRIEKAERRASTDLVARLDSALETGGALGRLVPMMSARVTATPATVDRDDDPTTDDGLQWAASRADTVASVTGLWRADVQRRSVITSVWISAALAEPVGRWLLDPMDPDTQSAGTRRVGQADVDALWAMCGSFTDADRQLGGGYARGTLIHFADQVMAPLLSGTYSDTVGKRLFAAAARLCDVAGFMCFDSGHQGLGQRYFIQALRMAKVGGDAALGAHILVDMSMQAHYLGRSHQAAALSDAAVATARRSGSASTLARSHAMHARTLASQGDAQGSDDALNDAESALGRARPDEEPTWIRFFTPQQLAAEAMYTAARLGRGEHVRRHAATALTAAAGMQRRHVLATTALAGSYLRAGDQHGDTDVDQACNVLASVAPTIGSLTSVRALAAVNGLRSRLTPHRSRPSVQRLERVLAHASAAG